MQFTLRTKKKLIQILTQELLITLWKIWDFYWNRKYRHPFFPGTKTTIKNLKIANK